MMEYSQTGEPVCDVSGDSRSYCGPRETAGKAQDRSSSAKALSKIATAYYYGSMADVNCCERYFMNTFYILCTDREDYTVSKSGLVP